MSKKLPADQPVRDQLLRDLDQSFVVEAAAGTGKTTVLVRRMVAVVKSGRARLSQVVAVTFTEKAAGELKLRLRELLEVERLTAEGAEHQRLTSALEELEVARVGTIHGLCADFLREYPVEAQVDPLFDVASEGDADALLSAAFGRWFERALADPGEAVRRMMRRRTRFADGSPRRLLLEAAGRLVEHRDFGGRWKREPHRREAELDALVPNLAQLAQVRVAQRPDDSWFADHLADVAALVDDLTAREAALPRDYDGLEAALRELERRRGWESSPWRLSFEGRTSAEVVALRDQVRAELRAFVRRADATLASGLREELQPVVVAYDEEKRRAGTLDFVDLLLRMRDLLRASREVRESLQTRFTHLFVDEFQDTDPLQIEVLLLLSASDSSQADPMSVTPVPGKLFVVGDPKQSVYRFRRADVLFYERVKQHLAAQGATVVYLSTSFRSTPGIQAAVNGAFEPAMSGGQHARYVPLESWRETVDNQPSVVALSVPRPYNDKGRITKVAVEACVPDTVAAFIAYLVRQSGWTVLERGARVPIRPRHICVLFRRFRSFDEDIPRHYAQALEARRVPHVLVGGRSFHSKEEVTALRTALLAIERPDDELSVYATLRGPLFALSDDRLLVFKHQVGRLHPLRPLDHGALSPPALEVSRALEVLRELHLQRHRRPVADTVHELLERTRAPAGLAFWSAGDQALANVLQLAEVSRRYEKRATSFREVAEALQAEADEGDAAEAPVVEEGTEGVRMMTVHTAKGLEFPVVILAEPTANVARRTPSHWVDPERGVWAEPLAGCLPSDLLEHEAEVLERDLEESTRITYVAATRACDLLVVPAVADKELPDTWTSVLAPSLYPAEADAACPATAPGCPPFRSEAALDRPGPAPAAAPLPGLHLARSGLNRVVWWDPRTLELGLEPPAGLHRHDALEDEPVAAAASREQYDAWVLDRAKVIAAGQRPTQRVVVARQLERPETPEAIVVESTEVSRQGRPRGKRFGALVHGVLAQVPLAATRAEIEAATALEARAVFATQEEGAAAVQAVEAALRHPLLVKAGSLPPSAVRREEPLVDVGPEVVVEGTLDLAFDDGQRWTVVEFKTDEELEPHLAAYQAQTEAYVSAIRHATGRPARGVILRV